MSTNNHTAIATGAAANAATINTPLGQLDAAITLRARVWAGKTTAPTVNDDSGDGIAVGDRWIDETNDREYVCLNSTAGAAVWKETTRQPGSVSTLMEGLQLIWNSATSISVGVGVCNAQNGDLLDITSALTLSSLSLSPSTWYHVYVYLSGGAPAAEVVTTAPVAWKGSAYSKTAATSRRYVGSIKSDGSGNVIKFIHLPANNTILYMKFQLNATPFRVLSAGTASTATAVSLTTIIPVTATVPYFRVVSSADQTMYLGDDNGVTGTQFTVAMQPGNTVVQNLELFHPIDGSQQVWYKFAAALGAGSGNIDVAGYLFNR